MSNYRKFVRHRPGWPRTMEKLVGREVEAAVELRTCGGEVFPAGTKFKVRDVTCGKLQLEGTSGFIRQVHLRNVNLIPLPGWEHGGPV